MPNIFISYRREDSAGWTGRIAERLRKKFGSESIFMDIDTIQPGTDFTEALRSAVGACDVLLAMIGPAWSVAKNAEGQTRLEDPNDWVRMELTTALSRNIPVIPVLVGGSSLPKTSTLPHDLQKLSNYQTHELTDKRWDYDSTRLIQVLEKVVRETKPKRYIARRFLRRRSSWVALVILGLLLAIASVEFLKGHDDFHVSDSGPTSKPPSSERALTENPVGTPLANRAVEVIGISADIYSHEVGFTAVDAERLKRLLEQKGIPSRIQVHVNPAAPDAIFLGALVGANEARIAISLIPYNIKYIFRPDYPEEEGGDPDGHLIGIGYMSTHYRKFRGRLSDPVKVSKNALKYVTEPGITNAEFQKRLRTITSF